MRWNSAVTGENGSQAARSLDKFAQLGFHPDGESTVVHNLAHGPGRSIEVTPEFGHLRC